MHTLEDLDDGRLGLLGKTGREGLAILTAEGKQCGDQLGRGDVVEVAETELSLDVEAATEHLVLV
jgi:hypothetical protein